MKNPITLRSVERRYRELISGTKSSKAARDPRLAQLVDDFEKASETHLVMKRKIGSRILSLLKRRPDPALEARVLGSFNAFDTAGFLRTASDGGRHASSFRALMNLRHRRKELLGVASCPEWLISSSKLAPVFARQVGLRSPRNLGRVMLGNLDLRPGMAIKPSNHRGSRGVYLYVDKDRIIDVKNSRLVDGEDALRAALHDYEQAAGQARPWHVEELIGNRNHALGIARDWKFYCFYGEIALIGVIERFPELRSVWLGPEGEPIERGFQDTDLRLTDVVPDPGMLARVRAISTCLPAPFVRIDLLQGTDELVFGEFTARPGTWYIYSRDMDARLGDMWLSASARLESDLLSGKTFPEWRAFLARARLTPVPSEAVALTG